MWETRKILGLPDLPVSCTAVRVPVRVGHGAAVHAVFDRAARAGRGARAVGRVPGPRGGGRPGARASSRRRWRRAGRDEVLVGRARADLDDPRGLDFFVCSDNLRKGAALNAVQIAERLFGTGPARPMSAAARRSGARCCSARWRRRWSPAAWRRPRARWSLAVAAARRGRGARGRARAGCALTAAGDGGGGRAQRAARCPGRPLGALPHASVEGLRLGAAAGAAPGRRRASRVHGLARGLAGRAGGRRAGAAARAARAAARPGAGGPRGAGAGAALRAAAGARGRADRARCRTCAPAGRRAGCASASRGGAAVLVPVMVGALERAERVGLALEARHHRLRGPAPPDGGRRGGAAGAGPWRASRWRRPACSGGAECGRSS